LVAALLDAALTVLQVREAHRVSKQATLRIGARVCAVLAAPVAAVLRQHGLAVRGEDQPARDLLLLDQRAPVVGVVLERARLEDGPARREDEQDREQQREQAEQLDDLAVHGLTPALRAGARPSARGPTRSGAAQE